MGTIAKVTAGGATHLIASTAYGTCNTAKNVVAKVATIQDSQAFTLMTGVTVHIKFTYHNTASNPTLNVNSTGAKAIKCYGTTAPGVVETASWYPGSVVSFTYDGTNWIQNDYKYDTNTTYSSKAAASGGTDVSLCTTGEKYTWNNKSNLALGTTATTALKGNATAQDIKYTSGVTTTIYDVVNETQQSVDDIAGEIEHIKSVLLTSSINCTYPDTATIGYRGTGPNINTLTGYPTGKNILCAYVEYSYVSSAVYPALSYIVNNVIYVSSKSSGSAAVGVRVLYTEPT